VNYYKHMMEKRALGKALAEQQGLGNIEAMTVINPQVSRNGG